MRPINQNLRSNEQIRVSPVRLIGDKNEQLGIFNNHEALRMAREAGLDLVEVAPNVRPPVCRLMNYGKWKYTQKKNVKKHHEQQTKEVRLRPKTDTHDREIKINRAIKFFKKGDKVQFTMVFRGRERYRREIAFPIFKSIIEEFGTRVKVERPPSMDGRHMIMILSAQKSAFDDVETREDAPKVEPSAHQATEESADQTTDQTTEKPSGQAESPDQPSSGEQTVTADAAATAQEDEE